MSGNNSSTNSSQNSKFLRKLASKLLEVPPAQPENINQPEDLVNLIFEQKYKDLELPTFHGKIDSDIQLNISQEPQLQNIEPSNDMWIYGYGSLVWKADFPFVARRTGFIKGFERRFYQNSIDHRGTAEKPGRVVTLIPSSDPNSRVWGVAYQIAADEKEKVLKHLDFREKNGYERHSVEFHLYTAQQNASFDPIVVTIYVANHNNESFAGHINDLHSIAEQVYSAVGPSGPNREYVYKLANAMRLLFPGEQDDHLFALEKELRELEARNNKMGEKLKNEILSMLEAALSSQTNHDLDHLEQSVREKFEEFSRNLKKTSGTN